MKNHEHSDNWDDGFETVAILRDFAIESPQWEPRYLPVIGLHDTNDVTVEIECVK